MGFPLTSNPNILGHDSLTHGSAHATNDVAWLGTWHAGVILKFGRMCSKGSDFSKGQIVKHSNWLFCNQHGCRFVLSCKAKCNEALIFIITMATQRTGLRWELQHNCDQMGPPLLCTHCSVVQNSKYDFLDCDATWGFEIKNDNHEFPDPVKNFPITIHHPQSHIEVYHWHSANTPEPKWTLVRPILWSTWVFGYYLSFFLSFFLFGLGSSSSSGFSFLS